MPWRLILFLVVLTIFALFAGFNVNNAADISVGFHTFKGVPVFISIFFSFLIGALVVLPFAFGRRLKKRTSVPKMKEGSAEKGTPSDKNLAVEAGDADKEKSQGDKAAATGTVTPQPEAGAESDGSAPSENPKARFGRRKQKNPKKG